MLGEYLTGNAFGLVLVFARMGAMLMVMPGFSAGYVPARVRLLIALFVTLVSFPIVEPALPAMPETVADLVRLFGLEVMYGLFLGLLAQAIMVALHLGGTAIGQNIGMMSAMAFDPMTASQGALVVAFLTLTAVLLIFVTGLHHLMIMATIESYSVFVPGQPAMGGDMASLFTDILQRASDLALRLAAPFIVFALLFQGSMGVVARLAPQFNVFFVGLPLQLMMGLGLLWVAIPGIMLWFLMFFEDVFEGWLG